MPSDDFDSIVKKCFEEFYSNNDNNSSDDNINKINIKKNNLLTESQFNEIKNKIKN